MKCEGWPRSLYGSECLLHVLLHHYYTLLWNLVLSSRHDNIAVPCRQIAVSTVLCPAARGRSASFNFQHLGFTRMWSSKKPAWCLQFTRSRRRRMILKRYGHSLHASLDGCFFDDPHVVPTIIHRWRWSACRERRERGERGGRALVRVNLHQEQVGFFWYYVSAPIKNTRQCVSC